MLQLVLYSTLLTYSKDGTLVLYSNLAQTMFLLQHLILDTLIYIISQQILYNKYIHGIRAMIVLVALDFFIQTLSMQ